MTYREAYAWCIVLSVSGIAWLMAGWPGPLIFWAGLYIGPLDIGWVEDLFDKKNETGKGEAPTESEEPRPLPDNVTPLPVKRRKRA